MTELTGRCLCGAVEFTADGVETDHHACHCQMCRRWAGGPVFASLVHSVQFRGGEHIGRYASSDWAERGFCKKCGTGLFYRLTEADQYLVCNGAFDDADAFKLSGEIFFDRKPSGYAFAGDHERLSEEETLAKFMPPA